MELLTALFAFFLTSLIIFSPFFSSLEIEGIVDVDNAGILSVVAVLSVAVLPVILSNVLVAIYSPVFSQIVFAPLSNAEVAAF